MKRDIAGNDSRGGEVVAALGGGGSVRPGSLSKGVMTDSSGTWWITLGPAQSVRHGFVWTEPVETLDDRPS